MLSLPGAPVSARPRKDNVMSDVTRRKFVTTAAVAGAAITIVPRHVLGRGFQAPSDTVNLATVGVGGMGGSNTRALMSQNFVAICDVDYELLDERLDGFKKAAANPPPAQTQPMGRGGRPPRELSKAQQDVNARRPRQDDAANLKRFADNIPKIQKYRDYREMLDKSKNIDGVVIATPDHMHAAIAGAAMSVGKHVYVQKPLCWSVQEARYLAKKAKENPKVVTQMGNQGHSRDEARTGYEYITGGAIGDIREIHVWTNRPFGYWPQGIPRPAPMPEVRGEFAGSRAGEAVARGSPGGSDVRRLQGAGGPGLESVPWRGARSAVPPHLPPVQLARLGRLGSGRAR